MPILRTIRYARMASTEASRVEDLDSRELWHVSRLHPSLLWRYRLWKQGHARAVFRRRSADARLAADATHLKAAAEWLALAQDATDDGGVVGRYRFDRGWTSSYPETTGYIVPTFIALSERLDARYLDRARRCVEFLLGTQLPNGAFPASEIACNTTEPSPFNTAQIVHGLLHWHQHQGDERSLIAAVRAGDWLVSVQDDDGAWRRWAYNGVPACYSAHLSCWLADLGAYRGDARMLESVSKHLDWVLAQRCAQTGWIDGCAFTRHQQQLRIADLHTLAYTLAGTLRVGRVLGRSDAVDAVVSAARGIADTLDRLGWIPGVLDWRWRARADSACLTGNAQMALVWMDLADQTGDDAWLVPAYKAIELVKSAQLLHSPNRNLRGGIPGADPLWGWYQGGVILSWSTKFFVDALLRKAQCEATP